MRFGPIIKDLPHIVHGGDYNPEQWMDINIWREDMRIAQKAGINSLSIGIFSWTALEPEEGRFTFTWMDTIMDLLAEYGMKAILATPSAARPAWMSEKYPEVLRVTPDGHRRHQGERHNHCLTSPVYRKKVTKINTLLAERYKNHPALGAWHISNEYGGECHCPLCQEKFRDWLKAKYKTLDALNAAWWTAFWSHTYTDWSQIHSPSPLGESHVHCHNLDWKRFTTDQFIDFYLCETKPLKQITPDVPCTHNLMGTYQGIDYFRFAKVLDFASWDAYPQWTGKTAADVDTAAFFAFSHDLMRGVLQKPFFLMESSTSATNWRPYAKLHRPGVHMLQSMQAVAHGADSVQYFQFRKSRGSAEKFHGAVIDHVGHENTRVTQEVITLGQKLSQLDGVVGLDTPAKAALIYDWENSWAIKDAMGLNNIDKKYQDVVMDHYKGLWSLGIDVDIICQDGDLSGYSLVVAPMLYMAKPAIKQSVDAFVRGGGTFVSTFASGYVDESDLCNLGGFPGPLKEALGIWAEEIDVLMPGDENAFTYKGTRYTVVDYAELSHLQGAEAISRYEQDFYAGMPALSVNHMGKGKAYYLAGRADEAFYKAFYRDLCQEAQIEVFDLPLGCAAVRRADKENEYLFLLNFAAEGCTLGFSGEDAFTGEELLQVSLPGHGFAVIKNPARG